MNPLIITCDLPVPSRSTAVAARRLLATARDLTRQGAAVLRLPATMDGALWRSVVPALQSEGAVVEAAFFGNAPWAAADANFTEAAPDMASLILNDEDVALTSGKTLHTHHSLSEMRDVARHLNDLGIPASFQLSHTGASWALDHLISSALAQPPYWCTLAFASRGSVWSPPTPAEYEARRLLLPPASEHAVFAATGRGGGRPGPAGKLVAYAVARGAHVRVGVIEALWDERQNPRRAPLVQWVADLGWAVGRPAASFGETRNLLGLTVAEPLTP